jgi:hypothetical protein
MVELPEEDLGERSAPGADDGSELVTALSPESGIRCDGKHIGLVFDLLPFGVSQWGEGKFISVDQPVP